MSEMHNERVLRLAIVSLYFFAAGLIGYSTLTLADITPLWQTTVQALGCTAALAGGLREVRKLRGGRK